MQVIKIKSETLQTDFLNSLKTDTTDETDGNGINILEAFQDSQVSEKDLDGTYVCVG